MWFGKGTILISGMMLLPKEARDQVNKKNIGRFTAVLLIAVNISMLLMWLDIVVYETPGYWLTYFSTALLFVITVVAIIIGIKKRDTWFRLKSSPETKVD